MNFQLNFVKLMLEIECDSAFLPFSMRDVMGSAK